MPYQKRNYRPGDTFAAEDANYIQTQYDEAAADLDAHKSATPLDHPDGSVTLAKLAASAMTSPGGTEANRLARTNASGRVGDAERLLGGIPASIMDDLSDVTHHRASAKSDGSTVTVLNITGAGYLLGAIVIGNPITGVTLTVDGVAKSISYTQVTTQMFQISGTWYGPAVFRFALIPPVRYHTSLKLEFTVGSTPLQNEYVGCQAWTRSG